MAIFLAFVALIGAGLGALMLSQVTMGVGFIAGACLVAIFAWMVQAGVYQGELLRAQREQAQAQQPAPSIVVPDAVDGTWICWPCGRLNRPMVPDCTFCGSQRPAGGR